MTGGRSVFMPGGKATGIAVWILIALYAAAAFLPLFPRIVPLPWIVAGNIIPVALFALVHGAVLYRLRGILAFAFISVVIGNLVENLGVMTGFPFGRYSFTSAMGPKFLLVPILMGPAYLGMGYLAWTLARLILETEATQDILAGSRIVTLPLTASFLMVGWDLTMDPSLSTIGHYWIWLRGGPYFGVPISNFLGWYLTNYVIYQLFALYLRRRRFDSGAMPAGYWRSAVILYAIAAAGAIVRAVPASTLAVADPAGTSWKIADINQACALVSVVTMGSFVLLASVRLGQRSRACHFQEFAGYVPHDLNTQAEFALQSRSKGVS
jgi:putative membrane protein